MIDDTFAQYNYCSTKIFFQFQMDYSDIPFDFCCPKCRVR